jgi:hypothetical protein
MKKHVKVFALIGLIVLFISSCVVLMPNRANNSNRRSRRRVELALPA